MTTAKRMMLYAAKYTGLFLWAAHVTRRYLRVLSYAGFSSGRGAGPLISIRSFERRLRKLHLSCFPVLSLAEAAGCLPQTNLPDHATVITLDGRGPNDREAALAVLQHYHFPATLCAGEPEETLQKLAKPCLKGPGVSNHDFNSPLTTCYKIIWLHDSEDIDSIEFEAELAGFLDICRRLNKNLLGNGQKG